jgi:hypothetical protein
MRAESQKYQKMNALEITSHGFRRARTRSLIQLGALMEKAGLLGTFGITLGCDLQRDPEMKEPIATLFKGLLVLNEMANSEEVSLPLWANQGLEALRQANDQRRLYNFKKNHT